MIAGSTFTIVAAVILLQSGKSAPVDYRIQIEPLFSKHCISCHGEKRQKAGLRLHLGKHVLQGSLNGPIIKPNNSAGSPLIQALQGTGELSEMPPSGPLSNSEIAIIARWIDEGAKIPPSENDSVIQHWAFIPPQKADVPADVHPVDYFLSLEWSQRDLKPASPTDDITLARRLHLDLTGLPPTPAELTSFSPVGYQQRIQHLLDSPHYGERWGRHFLDIWRYSDWYGYGAELRNSQKHIWRWRDWVVEAFNTNKGYHRMIQEMLAGDELAPTDPDTLRATGYLARSYYKFNRNVWLDDIVEHTGKAFLGITLNCARCHDHMYDPISQRDYFRVRAIFEPHQLRTDPLPGELDTNKQGLVRVFDANLKAPTYLFERGDDKRPVKEEPLAPGVPQQVSQIPYSPSEITIPAEVAHPTLQASIRNDLLVKAKQAVEQARKQASEIRLQAALFELRALQAKLDADQARYARPTSKDAPALIRHAVALHLEASRLAIEADLAEAEQKLKSLEATTKKNSKAIEAQKKAIKESQLKLSQAKQSVKVPPVDYPELLPQAPESSSGRRLAFAKWITNPQNPLTARVFVNHVWLRHFGLPLVPTVFDFGKNGRAPTHQKLLDWLAVEFMSSGWNIKHLHTIILTSAAYRRSSSMTGEQANRNRAIDPDNLYLWKMNPRPLEAEAIRDSLLSISGLLDPTRGGPELDHNDQGEKLRRSIYYRHAPEKIMPFLSTFDTASPTECYRRTGTVVPQQAMALVNSPVSDRVAEALAKQLPTDPSSVIKSAFERILSREATLEEEKLCREFLKSNSSAALMKVLFNHAEFTTIR